MPSDRWTESKPSHTIGGQFVRQLRELCETLAASECQYVRCVKPNAVAGAMQWDAPFVSRQLAQGGIFEAARAVRRERERVLLDRLRR